MKNAAKGDEGGVSKMVCFFRLDRHRNIDFGEIDDGRRCVTSGCPHLEDKNRPPEVFAESFIARRNAGYRAV